MTPAELEIIRRRKEMTALFKLGMNASSVGVHRTLNRPPKGKGWVPIANDPEGVFCRPDKVRESIEWYKKAYAILPDIVVLNQIALGYEMIGEVEEARAWFVRVREQAEREGNGSYRQAAEMSLKRVS